MSGWLLLPFRLYINPKRRERKLKSPRQRSGAKGNILWDGSNLTWEGDGKTFLRGVGEAFLTHPYVEGAFRRVIKEYKPAKQYQVCLFLACTYGKPYSQSYIHYKIIEALRKMGRSYSDTHQVILTNLGVVPRELEEYYPFCCYDWNPAYENAEVKKRYLEVLAKRLRRYIETFQTSYNSYACYLRHNSESYRAVKRVEKELKVRIPNAALLASRIPKAQIKDVSLGTYTYEEDLTLITPRNLKNLVKEVRKLLQC